MIDPSQYAGFEHLQSEVSSLEEYVRSVPRIDGVNEIFLPGDPEQRTLAKRSAEGIPLDDGNWNALLKLAEELGVTSPAV